jgi:hypothetical protein
MKGGNMILQTSSASVLAFLLFWAQIAVPDRQPPKSLRMSVLVFKYGSALTEKIADVSVARLAGEYYCGDGLGVNLRISLKANGSFDRSFSGCLGVYGTAAGTWSASATGIRLDAQKSVGEMAASFEHDLRIVSFGDHYLLVRKADFYSSTWQPGGPDCYNKEEAGKLINEERTRRINEVVNLIIAMPHAGASGAVCLGFSPAAHSPFSVLAGIIDYESSPFVSIHRQIRHSPPSGK